MTGLRYLNYLKIIIKLSLVIYLSLLKIPEPEDLGLSKVGIYIRRI